MKHTPGPWNLMTNPLHPRKEITSKVREYYIGSVNFEEHHSDISIEEAEANAALIAAAPELLETVERMTNLLESIERETGYCTRVTQDDAWKLIKKAKGGE